MSRRFWIWISFGFVLLAAAPLGFKLSAALKLTHSPTLAVSDPGSWRTIHKGVEYRKMTLDRSDPAQLIELKLLRFDTRWIAPRIVRSSQYQLGGANVKMFAEKSGALAVINANYFDEKGRPLGFLKTAGEEINRSVSKSSLFTGIFGMRDGAPFIMHRNDFLSPQADEALQSGPLLLHRGSAVEVTRGQTRYSRRAIIGIDQERRVVIAVTDALLGGLNWGELQELFSTPQWQLQTPELLNLDGGGSAQLYLKTATFQETIPGTAEVPVAVAFFAKAN
ncbi:MAG TPA: phosphodiester glycosidase family protein [Candidatus Binatia bacterium]|nr:phosphodiester glycosidase family protein [Candidatus Binatia bacterium]